MATNRTPRDQREPQVFAPDERPGADQLVYCKGCGTPLESRARLTRPKAVVDIMMCEACRDKYGHQLVPTPGSPTYCYRCGTLEEVFVAPGTAPGILPTTYHVCARCLPDRAARYRVGNFEPPPKPVPEEEATPQK